MQSRWHRLQVTVTALSGLFLPLANQLKAQEPESPAPQIKVIKIQKDGPQVQVLQPQRKLTPQPVRIKAVQEDKAVTEEGNAAEKKIQLKWLVEGDAPTTQHQTTPKVKVMAKALFVDEDGNVTELGPGAAPSGQLHIPGGNEPHVLMFHSKEEITGHDQIFDVIVNNDRMQSFHHAIPHVTPRIAVRPRRFRWSPRRVMQNAEVQIHKAHQAPAGKPKVIEYEVEIEKEVEGSERQIRLHIGGEGGQPQVFKIKPNSSQSEEQIFRIHAKPGVEIEGAESAHPPQKIMIHKEEQGGPVEIELIELSEAGEAGSAEDIIVLKGAEADVQQAQRLVERVQAQAKDQVLRHEMIEIVGAPDRANRAPAELKQMIEKLQARIAELEKKVAELEKQE